MLRTSSYTIYVDLPDRRDQMLLVHGYTGAYDVVSRPVAAFLRGLEAKRPPRPLYGEWLQEPEPSAPAAQPAPEILQQLQDRGYLTPLNPEQEEDLFSRLVQRLHARAQGGAPSYIFMPTYDCNLRCSYCFQDHMRTDDGFAHLLRSMRPSMIDRLFKAIPAIDALHGYRASPDVPRAYGLFGGEPLLAQLRGTVEAIMQRASDLGPATFWAVSNATDLDAYEDLLGPEGINRLQITIDGTPEEHDQRRIYADGSGTYERIAKNVDLALERGVVLSVRLNLDRSNVGFLPAIADDMVARGWTERRNFSAYTAPISAINEQTDRKGTFDSWELDQEITRLRQEHENMWVIGRPDEGIRTRARKIFDREEELLPQFKPSFCGAHDQMYIFDPFGDVYACWEKTGEPNIRMASIKEDGTPEFRFPVQKQWRSRSVASNPVCRKCRYALHCGGGCAILALGQRGKFHANYCDGYASRFRASVADAYRAYTAGEEATHLHDRVCDL